MKFRIIMVDDCFKPQCKYSLFSRWENIRMNSLCLEYGSLYKTREGALEAIEEFKNKIRTLYNKIRNDGNIVYIGNWTVAKYFKKVISKNMLIPLTPIVSFFGNRPNPIKSKIPHIKK